VEHFDEYDLQRDTRPPTGATADEADKARADCGDTRPSEPPEEKERAKIGKRVQEAAGIPAIMKTSEFGLREMGAVEAPRAYLAMNKVDGFDCQSCAWPSPDPEDRKMAEFCENGAKAVADELTHKRVGPEFFARHSILELLAQSDFWINGQGRLTHPMVLREGATHYTPISWDAALSLVAAELQSLASPDEAIFYTSGKTCNEAAFLFQLFARQFGTNNLPDCSNMCHESSGTALTKTIGIGKGTATLHDLEQCDLIVNIGNNPGTNHPRMLTSLEKAKRGGAKMIAINPMPETGLMRVVNPNPQDYKNPLALLPALLGKGAKLADLYVPVRVNGDAALLQGIMKSLFEQERAAPGTVIDRAFIDRYTSGFEAFAAAVEGTSWETVVAGSGVERATIEEAAGMIARAKKMVLLWCLGLTQQPNGVENVQQVINLLLIGGHIGRPGAGPICVRGHSNVQGDRTMGIWERPKKEFLDAVDREFGIRSPREPGYDTVESLHAMYKERAKVFFAISGNFFQAVPDTHYAACAFSRCRLTVHVATKLNRGHLLTGRQSLILPVLGRAEIDERGGVRQVATAEDSMGIINPTQGREAPASEQLLSDVEILVRLAHDTFGAGSPVDWHEFLDNDKVRDRIARVIPGFEDFNARLRKGPFYLPNGARERVFRTSDGKAQFTVNRIPMPDLGPGELLMTTVRSHDQFNTVVYGLDDRYRGIYNGRRVIFLNEDDMRDLGLEPKQWVDITSRFEGEIRVARRFQVVPYPIARKSAATYYPETNVLVPIRSVAPGSNQPAQKCVRITLRASEANGAAPA
jgi:molybdopterin-dependent oxidoreductase alpha subunit